MTESLREWLLSLVAVSLVWSVAEAVTPGGFCKRVCRMVGGLLMIVVMLRPLWSVTGTDLSGTLEGYLDSWQQEADNQYGEELMERVMIRSTQAYIEKQAQELGYRVEAEVSCRQEEGVFLPYGVTVKGNLTAEQRGELSDLLARELDIPQERQKYREAGT